MHGEKRMTTGDMLHQIRRVPVYTFLYEGAWSANRGNTHIVLFCTLNLTSVSFYVKYDRANPLIRPSDVMTFVRTYLSIVRKLILRHH